MLSKGDNFLDPNCSSVRIGDKLGKKMNVYTVDVINDIKMPEIYSKSFITL